jgi:hypothetical protein
MTVDSSVASGPAQTAEAVRQETARLCAEHYGRRLRSVVVTGSLARDEATFLGDPGAVQLLGDAEFLLIFEEASELPAEADTRELSHRIEASLLASHHLIAHIALSAGKAGYLATLQPHIFAFELRECGRVVWGDRGILALIPGFRASDIPLEDAWRLLANRMVEQLALVTESSAGGPDGSREARYRTVKLYLDMATSLLVFAGAYAPTYRRRAEILDELAQREGSAGPWPFPLRDFADRVARSTRLKLDPVDGSFPVAPIDGDAGGLLDWSEAVSYARRLWRWELARLGSADPDLGERALMRRWMRAQPLQARLRGWLYVARRTGWWRSWPHWYRWAKHGWRGSPRYLVYASASELLFRLPELLGSTGSPGPLPVDELCAVLPVARARDGADIPTPWKQLAADILWNYEQFLTDTRS